MKSITLLITSLLTMTSIAFAEGIPVDHETGKVTVPHTIISLSTAQIEEIQTLGTLTLTSEQERQVRAKTPQCAKRFNSILPVTMRDCCCGVEWPYVIALSRDSVAVLHSEQLSVDEIRHQLFKEWNTEFHVNERGEFYVEGQLIPFPKLLEAISAGPINPKRNAEGKLVHKSPEAESDIDYECYLYVEMPIGAKPTDAVYASRFKQLAAAAKKIGLDFHQM